MPNNMKGPNSMLVLAFVVFGLLSYLFWYNSADRELKTFTYSNFLKLVEEDKVEKVSVQDQHVSGSLKGNDIKFESYVVPSETLWSTLKNHSVNVKIVPNAWAGSLFLTFLFIGLLLAMFWFYFKQGQSGAGGAGKIFSVGKSRARFFSPNSVKITFKDVAGVDEAKEDLQDIIQFLKEPKKFGRLGAKIPRGILLNGAPGNGKTLLAKAVAGEASVPFFSTSGSDFVEVFVGVGASRVRDLFIQARRHAPCIVFIDEIDAVGRQRGVGLGGGNDEREQTLNQLLSEMDGFSTEHGSVIVIAATNRPDVLDKALLRPGRFDRIVEVPFPDMDSRRKILEIHSRGVKVGKDVNLERLARGTPGFSGADLESLVNEAALIASKKDKEFVDIEDFEFARDKLILGSERKTMLISEKEKRQTAYHEAGHALLNVLLDDSDPFHKVTIIPRSRALGVSVSLPEEDRYNHSKSYMVARIMISMGGLLAEKIIFNEQTTGASADIKHSTELARRMVCKFGMSDLGPIVFGNETDHPYLGRDIMNHSANYSEDTSKKIDAEISKIINECYSKAENLLRENEDKLKLLAEKLLEKETLQSYEVYELLGIKPRKQHNLKDEDSGSEPESSDDSGDVKTDEVDVEKDVAIEGEKS